jgi:hypothetical protein
MIEQNGADSWQYEYSTWHEHLRIAAKLRTRRMILLGLIRLIGSRRTWRWGYDRGWIRNMNTNVWKLEP